MKASWRWLAAPRLSVADIFLYLALLAAARTLKLWSGLPWWAVLAAVGAGSILVASGTGFVRGLSRTAVYDWRRWRSRSR